MPSIMPVVGQRGCGRPKGVEIEIMLLFELGADETEQVDARSGR